LITHFTSESLPESLPVTRWPPVLETSPP